MSKLVLFGFLLTSGIEAQTVLLYSGTARVTDLQTGTITYEELILKKIFAPENNLLTELACVAKPGKPSSLSPVYMKIEGQKITSISNRPDFSGNLSGTGTLSGQSWNWNYLNFSMRMKLGENEIRIEDGNFVVNDSLIARKQIFFNGIPVQLWDVETKLMTEETFKEMAAKHQCPEFD